MLAFFTLLTFIGAAIGFMSLVVSFTGSAPQAAAGAATAVALVVIPYCIAKLIWMGEQRKDTKAILAALQSQHTHSAEPPVLKDRA